MTFKHLQTGLMLIPAACFFSTTVNAQSIIFSSDQWPKRWERAMKNVSLNGHVAPPRKHERKRYRSGNYQNSLMEVSQQGGWGKQPENMRHKHKRARTPEYHYQHSQRIEEDPVKRRYALPGYNYGMYVNDAYPYNYYGSAVPVIPQLPTAIYPGIYHGGYPGIYPGLYPGVGAPGLFPFGGYSGVYPW